MYYASASWAADFIRSSLRQLCKLDLSRHIPPVSPISNESLPDDSAFWHLRMKKAEVLIDFRSCPVPESNQRHVDFQSTALPTELTGHKTKSSGDRIWTYDLRVMSPTSFQTAPPRDIKFLKTNGRRWIRTTEGVASRFTVCPLWPLGNPPILYIKPEYRYI